MAQEPKHVFATIKHKAAYFKHRKGKTLSFVTQSSYQLKFAANKPKGVFDKLECKNVFHLGKSGKRCS